MPDNGKDLIIIDEFQKALEIGKKIKSSVEICVSVKLHEGGIRDAQVTIQRRIV